MANLLVLSLLLLGPHLGLGCSLQEASASAAAASCPPFFARVGSKCIFVSAFYRTFSQCQLECFAADSKPVCVTNVTQFSEIADYLLPRELWPGGMDDTVYRRQRYVITIGGGSLVNDALMDGAFWWWWNGCGSNASCKTGHCIASSESWNAVSCTDCSEEHRCICEYAAELAERDHDDDRSMLLDSQLSEAHYEYYADGHDDDGFADSGDDDKIGDDDDASVLDVAWSFIVALF